MTTRDFDPVFSAALRNELEHLADGPDRAPAARRPVLRRPQAWITAATALVLLVATLGVLRLTVTHDPQPARSADVVDPLSRVTDPADPWYVEGGVLPLLHIAGTGPGTYSLDVLDGFTSVRPLLTCSPSADFRITVGKGYGTRCAPKDTTGWGDIPVKTGIQPIAVQVPEGVHWRLAVIVTPQAGTTFSTLRVEGAPAPPVDAAVYPAPEREKDVPVAIARGGSGTTTGRLFAPVDELALVTSCRGTGGLVVTLSNGLQFGTDDSPLPCSAAGSPSAQSAGNDTTRGYRGDGAMRYTVRALGDVAWSATFSSRTEQRLPYPAVSGTVVARTRGSSVDSSVTLGRAVDALRVVVTCTGSGTLAITAQESGVGASGSIGEWCDPDRVKRTELSVSKPGGLRGFGAQHMEVRPTGSVQWTVTFLAGD